MMTHWQHKSINYFYSYKGTGSQAGNPLFEISSFYPQLDNYYPLLVGLFYSIPYAFSGLYMGQLTKTGNRKWLMVSVLVMLSCMQLGTGIIPSFAMLACFRFLHGAISSAIDPMAYSLVSDIFPPEKRTTANSFLSAANFLGIAISSMTIILIKKIGWQNSYKTMGAMGIGAATMMALFIKEPIRNQFDKVAAARGTEIDKESKTEEKKPFFEQLKMLF